MVEKASEYRPYFIKSDPNVCFVLFSSTILNASSISMSLQSLLSQVAKQPADRKVKNIEYIPIGRKLIIHFEELP